MCAGQLAARPADQRARRELFSGKTPEVIPISCYSNSNRELSRPTTMDIIYLGAQFTLR